jgi:hypothetical protein
MAEAKEQAPQEHSDDFAKILHDRARSAGTEYHRLLIALATGVLAVYFLALTSRIEPALSRYERVLAVIALTLMGLAVLAGLIGWFADAMRNYYWALAIDSSERSERQRLYRVRDRWLRMLRFGTWSLSTCFVLGIICAVVYMVSRVLN